MTARRFLAGVSNFLTHAVAGCDHRLMPQSRRATTIAWLIAMGLLACGYTAKSPLESAGGNCTLLGTASVTTPPTVGAGRLRIDYVLEVGRCDDTQLADYYACKGAWSGDESLYVGVLPIEDEQIPAYYQSTECKGSGLPNLKPLASPATEMEPSKPEDSGDGP